MLKFKVLTIISILLDILAMALIFKIAMMSTSLLLWIFIIGLAATFIWDIGEAITFYHKIK